MEGAYDIRHEIIKKRIDKALIKGSAERLTQPGKIAIVYSQRQEGAEYLEYIDYLQAAGYLQAETEEVELEDLQGAQGLKALRVPVDLRASRGAGSGSSGNRRERSEGAAQGSQRTLLKAAAAPRP